MTTETGGPAFPQPDMVDEGALISQGSSGMTLRDYFAAKAMQKTMIAFEDNWSIHPYEQFTYLQWASERAYAMADAMMTARKA